MAMVIIILIVVLLVSLRLLQTFALKIVILNVILICAIHLVILYKNSLNKYEIGIFCFFCIQLFAVLPTPSHIDNLISASYLLSYRYGISSRSLIATIVDFFTKGEFISKYFVWQFIFCFTVYLSFIISVYLGGIIHKFVDDLKLFMVFMSFLYLSSFTSPVIYFGPGNYGRLEIYALLFTLLFVHIINKPAVQWLTPFLALLIMATHIIFVFFFIPFVIIMLLLKIFSKTKIDKQAIILLVVTIAVILLSFLGYILYYKKSFVFEDAYSLYNILYTKTDLFFREDDIHMLLFAGLNEHIDRWKTVIGLEFIGFLSIIINLPLLVLFVTFWFRCFYIEVKKPMKIFFLLPVLVLLYHSFVFFMFYDFGRWMIMIINVQFMLFFYMIFIGNQTVLSVVEKIIPFVKKHRFFLMLIFLLMIFLGPINAIGPSGKIMRIIDNFVKVL